MHACVPCGPQDTLLGCKLVTQRDTFIRKDLMMNILMNIQGWDGTVPAPTILKPEPLWTGKQVHSRRPAAAHPRAATSCSHALLPAPLLLASMPLYRIVRWSLTLPGAPLARLPGLCPQIFSVFLPPVNLERTSSWAKDHDDRSFSFDDSAILIRQGQLIHG